MRVVTAARRPRRIPARTFDLALVALVLLVAAAGIAVWIITADPRPAAIAGLSALGVAQAVPLLWRRTHPVHVFAIVAATYGVYEPLSSPVQPVAVIIAIWSVGAYATRRAAAATAVLGIGALVGWVAIHAAFIGKRTAAGDIVTWAVVLVAAWALGLAVGTRRGYTSALEERARLLEERREAEAHAAVADERARIARELHDVVAHHVTSMVVQAGGARSVLDKDPDAAKQALHTIEDTGRRALNELRRLLGVVRADAELAPQPRLDDIEALIAQTPIEVDVRVEGDARALSPGLDLSAYRIVQEALTNVVKHAGDARAHVTLRYTPDDVQIEVTDDGAGRTDTANGAGHGLVGMRERVAMFGGELHAGPRVGGGWTVRARLPIR